MRGTVPLSYQDGAVDEVLASGVGLKASHAGFFEQALQSSPRREVEAAEILHLEPVSDGLPHQQVADFLRGIRPIHVAPQLPQFGPMEVRQVCKKHFYCLRPMMLSCISQGPPTSKGRHRIARLCDASESRPPPA